MKTLSAQSPVNALAFSRTIAIIAAAFRSAGRHQDVVRPLPGPFDLRIRKLALADQGLPYTAIVMAANGLIVAFLYWSPDRAPQLIPWFVCNLAYALLMGFDRRLLRAARNKGSPWLYRSMMLRAPVLALIWGGLPWIVLRNQEPGEGLLLGVIVNGMIAGGMMRLSIFPKAALTFGIMTASLTSAATLAVAHVEGFGMIVLQTFFIYVMSKYVLAHDGILVESWSATNDAAAAVAERKLLDPLTGLPNRAACLARIGSIDDDKPSSSLVVIDIERFCDLNETYGYPTGDFYLQAMAGRLAQMLSSRETLYRIDGDKFAIFTSEVDTASLLGLASQLAETFANPVQVGELMLSTRLRLGIAKSHEGGDLVRKAEIALAEAKTRRTNRIWFFNADMHRQRAERRSLLKEIERAITQREFALVYQPQIDMNTGHLVGCEALLRWHHPTRGFLGPAAFIETLANSQFATAVGWWGLDEACRQLRAWQDKGVTLPHVSVNLFDAQFLADDLEEQVISAIARHGIPPQTLELEITEDIALGHSEALLAALRRLKMHGVRLAFDDFGTGYASLSSIKSFPLDRLKIDRSFVRDLCANGFDGAVVSAVLAMAGTLGMDVVVEGVETEAQATRLRDLGCRIGQGFLFAPGLSADMFQKAYASNG